LSTGSTARADVDADQRAEFTGVSTWSTKAPVVRVSAPVRVDRSGATGPTKGQAEGPLWRRTSSGFYVPAHVSDELVEQRIVEQGSRLREGAVTGWAALRLLRGGYFDGLASDGRTSLPVQVAANGDRLRSEDGLAVHRVEIDEEDVVIRYGVRCAAPERALFDAVRWSEDLVERVTAIDMAAAAEISSPARLRAFALAHRGTRGRMLVLEALSWASERAESPQEVRLRMIWRRRFSATRPEVNRVILDDAGRRLGKPDLVDPDLEMGAEFDGAEHRARARHRRDVRRLDDFLRAGLEIAVFVGADLDDEDLVVDRLQATRARAGRVPRRWKLAPPGRSLDERLDERDRMIAFHETSPGHTTYL
jgi:hypothetical protein